MISSIRPFTSLPTAARSAAAASAPASAAACNDEFHPLSGLPQFHAMRIQASDLANADAKQAIADKMLAHMQAYPSVTAVVGMAPQADGNTALVMASRADALDGSQIQGAYQIIQHLASSPSLKADARANPTTFQPAVALDTAGRVLQTRLPGAQTEATLVRSFQDGGEPNRRDEVSNLIKDLPQDKRVAVLIGGPSGAGKSSLIEDIKKMAGDRKVVVLSGDMYFRDVDEPDFPKTSTGSWYFDDIKAMDMDRFKNDIAQLISTGAADVPVYNFKDVRPGGWHIPGVNVTGYREDKPEHLEIGPNDLLLIDSLHSTNPAIIDKLQSVKLTHASVYFDSERAEDRLLRRTVRDFESRSRSPRRTMLDWVNSTFPGEKSFVRPTIAQIDPGQDVFFITKFPNDQGLSFDQIQHKVEMQEKWGLGPTYPAFKTPDDKLGGFALNEAKRLRDITNDPNVGDSERNAAKLALDKVVASLVINRLEQSAVA